MRIGIFCTASHSVPPKNYGGTQMVNWETAEALVELGHEVYLFAPKGSHTSANLIEIDSGWGYKNELNNVAIHLVSMLDDLDIIIDTSAFGIPGINLPRFPYVARMGGDTEKKYCCNFDRNIIWPSWTHFNYHNKYDCGCGRKRRRGINSAVVIPKPVCYRATVSDYNDLPLHKQGEGDYYLYLGLFAEHKGTHLAIEFAKKAGVKLVMVGEPDQSPYYNEKILPEYKKGNVDCYQPFSFNDKWELLAKAKAVIFPSICEEGDPNVPKEALLVGTPVIALKGTVSEIVDDGITGFVCKDVDGMVIASKFIEGIHPLNCRKEVLRKFGLKKYIDNTLIALQRAIDGDRWI